MYSILALSSADIWLEAGIHWNGTSYVCKPMSMTFPSYVIKMWGTSSSDIYVVVNGGLIARYSGTSWSKIESGTITTINDMCRYTDNDETIMYCVVSVISI